jgi:protein TonB
MPRRRVVTCLSIAIHAFVVTVVVVAQLLAAGPLPVPRRPLAFQDFTVVHLQDIKLPPRARRSVAASGPAVSPNAAPLVAPPAIRDETGIENIARSSSPRYLVGIESGGGGIQALQAGPGVAPPPPPAPSPKAPVRLSSGAQMPRKLVHVDPIYPPIARSAHVGGVVILDAVLDATGRVSSVRVLRSVPLLDQAAVDAVRQWRFTPTLLNGDPVPVAMTVTVKFSLR